MSHLLNVDILYHVLQHAVESSPNDPLTHRAQREALYTYALVSRMWSQTAQSLLFRHVFLQIRPSMLAFLGVIDHKTERGRRLASCVRVATIKLSRSSESSDPPSLPMIHPRHLPALLAHLPSLHELRLRLGGQPFVEELASMRGLSSIRVLALSNSGPLYSQSYEVLKMVGLWGSLQSLTLAVLPELSGTLPPPSFALREFNETGSGYSTPETVQWILERSVGVLEHCTLSFVLSVGRLRTALSDHFSTIRSLTLGHVEWDEEFCDALYNFANLIELRMVQFVSHMGPRFPGKLPDTLQYLTFAIPAYKESTSPHRSVEFKHIIPTQLKTYTTILRETDRLNNEYGTISAWVKGYEQDCRHMGVDVRLISLRASNPGVGELCFSSHRKSPTLIAHHSG